MVKVNFIAWIQRVFLRNCQGANAGPVIRLFLVLMAAGCRESQPEATTTAQPPTLRSVPTRPMFTEISDEAKIVFLHEAGEANSYEFPRSMGSGCGFFDANGDGLLDVFLINGGKEISVENNGTLVTLFLQTADGKFQNYSTEAGFIGSGYGMGAAVGDVDNDGDNDVYLTKYGPDQLFLNDGTGRFIDVTKAAGIVNPQWSTAAAMVDLNKDGWLDIVVANYVDYFPGTHCTDGSSRQDFCGPQDFHGTTNRILMNSGSADGTRVRFEDRTASSGVGSAPGKSLGLICRDFNNDGDVDIFFANDGEPNQLWIQRQGTFSDEAVVRGVAVNRLGEPEANMGTLLEDLTGDGVADLLVTHLSGEMNTLWQGSQDGYFTDQTPIYHMGISGVAQTGFGVVSTDVDSDGGPEILVANGRVKRDRHRSGSSTDFWDPYSERNQIFQFTNNNWDEVVDATDGFTGPVETSRGLATGDIDLDGDQDLLVTSIGTKARLYRNNAVRTGRWLTVVPMDPGLNRIAYGAAVTVVSGSRQWKREIIPHSSYLSSLEPVAHFGLGNITEVDFVDIIWPGDSTTAERFVPGTLDQRIKLNRGEGTRIDLKSDIDQE